MKIANTNGVNITKIYSDNKRTSISKKGNYDKKYDTLEISKEGQEIGKYIAKAQEISAERTDKVEKIKAKVRSGLYDVSSEDLAKEIVKAIKGENI